MTVISVFGLGYVGSTTVACFADEGYTMIGVDVSPIKVDMIQRGHSPIVERGVEELLARGVAAGRIRATTDSYEAVHASDISFLCVGTPSNENGSLDLTYVKRVCETIGRALATKERYHTVVVRSTMLPGTTEQVVVPLLESASGKSARRDFGVCFNPEFLREGTSVEDFYSPPFSIIGTDNERVGAIVAGLYAMLKAPPIVTEVKVAEMLKYVCNAFHALKVTFANEIGNLCKQQEIDSHAVMDIFCQDKKLNLSPYYLKSGFAFGGSCLPKDLRALLYQFHHYDLYPPVLEGILPSNYHQIDRAYQMVKQTGYKRVGVLGFSFKAGTDDLRESPMVELTEHLIGKGYQVCVYDRNVSLANLHGANRTYIEQEIPHISCLMVDSLETVLERSQVIIIGNGAAEFDGVLARLQPDQVLIDLVRTQTEVRRSTENYRGICW